MSGLRRLQLLPLLALSILILALPYTGRGIRQSVTSHGWMMGFQCLGVKRERERERERVWLNPPYGRETFLWLERLATHGNGTALIFARTETKGFHEQVWDKATALFFFKGRLCFHRVDGSKGGTANAPSCLIAYGEYNAQRILEASQAGKIQGKFVRLKAVRCSKNS